MANPLDLMRSHMRLNSLIDRAQNQFPVNAAARAAIAQRAVMFYDPRNNPSRSQFSQGYTSPFQYFAASNTWQTPSGQMSRGRRATQPSTKFAGPRYLIPTVVPWG